MQKSISRTVSAIAAAALVAFAVTILPGASDQVAASSPLNTGKGDRLDVRPLGANCAQQAWPHFDAACVKDSRQPLARAKAVRIVATDRGGSAR